MEENQPISFDITRSKNGQCIVVSCKDLPRPCTPNAVGHKVRRLYCPIHEEQILKIYHSK